MLSPMASSPYIYKKHIEATPGVLAILARHGSTGDNDATVPRVRGWHDLPLDDKGKIEAQLLASRLRKYNAQYIVSSDFMRDVQTSDILSNLLDIKNIEVDVNSRTWDVGNFSGQPLELVNPAIEELYKNPWIYPPGSQENFNEFSERVTSFLDDKFKLASISIYRPIIIVTHGKNIALCRSNIIGGNAWESFMPKPAGFAVVSVGLDRVLKIEIEQPEENVIEDI